MAARQPVVLFPAHNNNFAAALAGYQLRTRGQRLAKQLAESRLCVLELPLPV